MRRRCFCSMHAGYSCVFSSHIHSCLYIETRCLQIRLDICIHIHQWCLYTMHVHCNYASTLCTRQYLDRFVHHHGNLTNRSSCDHQLHSCTMHWDCSHEFLFHTRLCLYTKSHYLEIRPGRCRYRSQQCYCTTNKHYSYFGSYCTH